MARLSADYPVRIEAVVRARHTPRTGYRWFGVLEARSNTYERLLLFMTGSTARWIAPGEHVIVEARTEPREAAGYQVLQPGDYRLWRIYEADRVLVWPLWRRELRIEKPYYRGVVLAREAASEEDYEEIAGLEQYHYASKEELVAVWKCPRCGYIAEANTRPTCPRCGSRMVIQEIRGSLPSSRFLVLELLTRKEYEPRIVGYVRVDTPIPLMHRRVPRPDGSYEVERLVREKVFPKDWFHPTFWPLTPVMRRKMLRLYPELAEIYSRPSKTRFLSAGPSELALLRANTSAARIARVVVHPDFRGGGLGVLAVRAAVEWVRERRIPEMKREKHVVETIAAMARYNPFFERAGFRYMWDTASGRPVLMYPLTRNAAERIERYLREDPVGRVHGGRLYTPRFTVEEPLSGPIVLRNVSKSYRTELDLEGLSSDVAEALRSFGVERRVVERSVLRDVDLCIEPGSIVAIMGLSGAGKTTLLRLILGAAGLGEGDAYTPDEGTVEVPGNVRPAALLPGEIEPVFGDGSLLEEIAQRSGDVVTALEVLSASGISDAVLYRARIRELSTGQKERAKLAALLALRPNLLVIDEFMAHLDETTAKWVSGRLARLARRHRITLVLATHRREILEALQPDKILIVGYGGVVEAGQGWTGR